MLLSYLNQPITLINLEDCGINADQYLTKTGEYYSDFEWDKYLFRQHQIEFLQRHMPADLQAQYGDHFWLDFYVGMATADDLGVILKSLTEAQFAEFNAIKPTRRRAISEFEMTLKSGWCIERVAAKSFGQEYAKVAMDESLDFRLAKRTFDELSEDKVDGDLLKILDYLATNLREGDPAIKALNVVVHHTQVVCYPGCNATNSPEGIHQDGMDYIVSALVVERSNIQGGTSIVYGNDRKTKIFEAELKAGQGILQPDRRSELWHAVTPISCRDDSCTGSRSTIGFDFTIRER